MKHQFLLLAIGLALTLLLAIVPSCSSTDPDPLDCTGLTPTFTADIQPIFAANCATQGCHGSTNPAHNINLATYAGALDCVADHDLRCSIEHGSGCDPMPENAAKLPAGQIEKIICWVQNGTPQ